MGYPFERSGFFGHLLQLLGETPGIHDQQLCPTQQAVEFGAEEAILSYSATALAAVVKLHRRTRNQFTVSET